MISINSHLLFASGYYNTHFITNKSPSLKFTTNSQNLLASTCSAVVTVRTYRGTSLANVTSPLVLNLAGTNGLTFFSDSSCTVPITTVTIPTNTSTANFYFLTASSGTGRIDVTANSYPLVSQNETLNSNPFIWTGASDSLWESGANWSGLSAPGINDIAVFNSDCSTCTVTSLGNINVGGVRIQPGYSGSISQGLGVAITTGNKGWIQQAGSFSGSSSAITFNGPFKMTAGSFNSTSGVLSLASDYILTGSSSLVSTGTVRFDSGCCSTTYYNTGSAVYQNVIVAGGNSTRELTGTMNVNGDLTFVDGYTPNAGWLNGGTIEVKGNVTYTQFGGGSTVVKLVGSGTQTLTGGGLDNTMTSIHIASTGTVNLVGTFAWSQSNYTFRYESGALNAGTSHLVFRGGCGAPNIIQTGPDRLNDVTIGVSTCSGQSFNVSGTVKVGGHLSFANFPGGSNGTIAGGTIEAYGDVTGNTFGYTSYSSSTVVKLVGNGIQNLTGSTTANLPSITIASTGTVNLIGTVKLAGSTTYTYTSGTVNAGTSTLWLAGGCSTSNAISSSVIYYNLTIKHDVCTGGSFVLSGTFLVSNSVTLDYGVGSLNGGLVEARGSVIMASGGSGSTALTFKGSSLQTITQTGGSLPSGTVTVDNSAGIALGSSVSWNAGTQLVNVINGFINMSGNNLTVRSLTLNGNTVTKGGGVLTVNSSVAGNGALYGGTVNP